MKTLLGLLLVLPVVAMGTGRDLISSETALTGSADPYSGAPDSEAQDQVGNEAKPTGSRSDWPRTEDVESPEALLAAVYDVISGPVGEVRNWDRFRSLFTADARLAAVASKPGVKSAPLVVFTPGEYAERNAAWLEQNGFFEVEVARKVDRFGHVVQVFSTYEARRAPEDAEPFMTGINSFQLISDGERWWVHSILWEAAHAELSIPGEYRE